MFLSTAEGRKKAIMYMVTPYMDHDLSGLLENPDVHFTEPQIKCYMLQLLEGLRYLHDVCVMTVPCSGCSLMLTVWMSASYSAPRYERYGYDCGFSLAS